MNKIFTVIILIIVIIGGYFIFIRNNSQNPADETNNTNNMEELISINPISHATMVINIGDVTIYNDPVGDVSLFSNYSAPNIILVSDIHGDHLSEDTLKGVIAESTTLIAPEAVIDELTELKGKATSLKNGETIKVKGISITAIPMYNLPESPDNRHVKGRGNGYILEKDDTRIYIAGDTAGIPEMRSLSNIDIAFVPMNLPYTMDVEEAADAVLDFSPKTVYPYHYRGQDGLSDISKFKELVNAGNSEIEVILLDWYKN